jgi:hypothetical protein
VTDLLSLGGLLSDPRFGIPLMLLAFALATWLLAGPARQPRREGWERPVAPPDRDPVSRSYLAVERGQYSVLLREAYDRLDRAVATRTGRSISALPWRVRKARALGVPDPKGLSRLRSEFGALEIWSLRLETDSWLRRDFWRSAEASRRRFTRRLAGLLALLDGQLKLWEQGTG